MQKFARRICQAKKLNIIWKKIFSNSMNIRRKKQKTQLGEKVLNKNYNRLSWAQNMKGMYFNNTILYNIKMKCQLILGFLQVAYQNMFQQDNKKKMLFLPLNILGYMLCRLRKSRRDIMFCIDAYLWVWHELLCNSFSNALNGIQIQNEHWSI